MTGRRFSALTGALFVLAWFLPAAQTSGELIGGRQWGWQAFVFALSPILGNDMDGGLLLSVWMVMSAASNVLLVVVLVLVTWRPKAVNRYLVWSLAVATAVNAYWFFLPDMRSDLRIGYYLWLAAFPLGTISASMAVRERSAVVGAIIPT